jgi:Glycosyl transferase family 11
MISVNLCGGIGNTLFQYAFARSLAQKHNVCLLDSCTQYGCQIGRFNTTLPVLPHPGWRWIAERSLRYDPHPEIEENSILAGYWQCENYFFDVETDIQKELTPKEPVSYAAEKAVEQMGDSSVMLHVRRGDYLTWAAQRHGVLPLPYYFKAASHIMEHVENAKFFVFSDEPGYQPALPCNMTNVHLLPHEDLWAMGKCKHAIIANSSFSWWGAWLGADKRGGLVVAPKQWFRTGNADAQDIVPSRWTQL